MEISEGLSDLKAKLHKSKEIARIYLKRYFDWDVTPEPDKEFLANLQSDGSIMKRFLLENAKGEEVVEDADRICSGQLRVFGINSNTFKDGIRWHRDYYTGYEWPLKPFNRIYDPNDSGVDLNVPFEISRLQFVPTLIQAYEITKESKYVLRLMELIDSWIEKNPLYFGVNWWSCMDVGLRAVNLVLATGFLLGKTSNQKIERYLKTLWKHALYIYEYEVMKSRIKSKNNHFLGAMLGMLSVSLCFKGERAKSLRESAVSALKKEIQRQFLDDGGNFESATAYHQFSIEVVLVAILLLRTYKKNNVLADFVDEIFGSGIRSRLIWGLNLVRDYMACYGESPHFGDSSDCRVFIFRNYFSRKASNHGFLLSLGRYSLNYDFPTNDDRVVKLYPKSGYACFKNQRYGIVAFAGPKGTNGSGGHGHNDKCSFVMQVNGHQLFVDSGTYIYNPKIKERFELKKGCAHNIIAIDNKEQCEISPNIVFGLMGEINPQVRMVEEKDGVNIQMQQDGYKRFKDLGLIIRQITCQEDRVLIEEKLEGSGCHEVSVFFNLHPSVSVNRFDKSIDFVTGAVRTRLKLPESFVIEQEQSFYSNSYHEKVKSNRVVATARLTLPASWKAEIRLM